ncbi:MAG: TetR-like C-terminal domain-containing protein, partial [Anaerobacillus sp.]
YYLKEVDQVHLVRGLRSILHGMVDLHQKNGFQLSVSLEESLKVIVETYILGIIERYGNR